MALIKLVINTINIRNITMRTLLIIVSVWMQYYYGLHVLQKYVFLHTMACAFKTAVHERCSWGLINWNGKEKKVVNFDNHVNLSATARLTAIASCNKYGRNPTAMWVCACTCVGVFGCVLLTRDRGSNVKIIIIVWHFGLR